MKLLINASTLSGTGVTQVALSFINECKKYPNNEYYIFLSKTMSLKIDCRQFEDNFHFYHINHHPIYGLKGFYEKMRMKKLCRSISPDAVFSVFGPSCWTPKNIPHLQGYAYPHYVYPDSPLFSIMSFKELLHRKILKLLHVYFLKRNGSYYVCETHDVSHKLAKLLNVDSANIFTVSNCANHYFDSFVDNGAKLLPSKEKNEFRFIILCSPAQHKNLQILNQVIPLLNKHISGIKFVVTIAQSAYQKLFTQPEIRDCIINAGEVHPSLCPQLYSECDALFYPTLLECFSAAYPEAMTMKKPILTSNLPFATSTCGDAALYFDPMNPNDIVDKIIKLVKEKSLQEDLIRRGTDRLKYFDNAEERALKYLKICEHMVSNGKNNKE